MRSEEEKILNFYRKHIKESAKELKEEMENLSLNDRARLFAFLQTRDVNLYRSVETLFYGNEQKGAEDER